VAIVDAAEPSPLRTYKLGQNLGQTVQVTSGFGAGDSLVNLRQRVPADGSGEPVHGPGRANAMANAKDARSAEPPPPCTASGDGQATTHETDSGGHAAGRIGSVVGLLSAAIVRPLSDPAAIFILTGGLLGPSVPLRGWLHPDEVFPLTHRAGTW